jgi:hypothetical protein
MRDDPKKLRADGRWMRSSAIAMTRIPRPSAWTVVVVAAVFALSAESLLAVRASQSPPLQVDITVSTGPPNGLSGRFTLTSGLYPLSAHLALVPGAIRHMTDPTVLYFADSTYPSLYAPVNDVIQMEARIASYLRLIGSNAQIQVVSGPDLPAALFEHPTAFLVFLGQGVLPDSVFAPGDSLIHDWVVEGGTLVWAGGPLAYWEGHPIPTGFYYDSLKWWGQQDLAGFPLTDVSPVANASVEPATTYSTNESSLGAALGLSYPGIPSGANVTEVTTHHGVVLGSIAGSLDAPGVRAPVSSLVYVPDGLGSIFYFGGALFHGLNHPIPDGSVTLSQDVGILLGLRYLPGVGPSAFTAIDLGSLDQRSVTLTLSNDSGGVVALVTSSLQGTLLEFWASQIVSPPTNTTALGVAPAAERWIPR